MKFLHKIFIVLLVLGVSSCDNFKLEELLDNPNAVTPEKAQVNFLYNSVQLSFKDILESSWGLPARLSRMSAMQNFTYVNAATPTTLNTLWTRVYAGNISAGLTGLLPDVDALVKLTDERGLDVHGGSARIMKAYALLVLVDLLNNVPYSEALKGTDVISPKVDDGASVYAAAEALLDEAINLLSGTTAASPEVDLFFNGDPDKWVTAAKSLKLRIYVTTRLVDGGAAGKINSLLADGDLIDEASEDFEFHYGNNRVNPNSRHFLYNNHYENSDGDYMSNYYMWLLKVDKGFDDPRLRFYFYRQDGDLTDEDVNVWECIHSTTPFNGEAPDHYKAVDPRLPYCIAHPEGYFGRDHGNGAGIPPDGPIRTRYGLYPMGGKFDDNSFENTQNSGTDGALGEGIFPVLLSSYMYFLRAEAALTLGTNDDPREMLEKGVRASIAKTLSFASKVDLSHVVGSDINGNPITAEQAFFPKDEDIEDYVAYVLDQYDNNSGDERLNVVMKEYFIALWGNGLEAYNNYRRTGMPLRIQPAIDNAAGAFARSALYPSDHVNLNANATQKSITDPVFWDNNPPGLTY